jgi:iron(III) transport system permease protein
VSVRQRLGGDDLAMRAALVALAVMLAWTVLLPLGTLLVKSFQSHDGAFVGLANFRAYFRSPALSRSIVNSLQVAGLSAALCVLLAFAYAYGLTRTCMPLRGPFRVVAQLPLLAPSLLPAIGLVYLFGNQGLARGALLGASIYGRIGVIAGEVFWTFPHALIIVTTALSISDARLHEAATSLGASPWRIFWTVTLPAARYGLVSAFVVVFTLVITDFGVPKVIGGQLNVMATDVYKQVVGQQNFQMGAVVAMLLLAPALAAFVADRVLQRRQAALLSSQTVPYRPTPSPLVDGAFLAVCSAIALALLAIVGTAAFASLARLWPYDLTPSLRSYHFDDMDGGGWLSFWNSLRMAAATAAVGTVVVFTGAWLVERTRRFELVRGLVHLLALLPLAVPGLVLGLGYVFFFNAPRNPLHVTYGTMAILVMSTIAHFYSVAHLTGVTALKQVDPEVETVSASLRVALPRTFLRVTVPLCLPAILEIASYLFLNAMTTVSAVVFLYSPRTTLAAVAVLNMDDAGDVAPAAAMATLILVTSAGVRVLYALVTRGHLARAMRWRR